MVENKATTETRNLVLRVITAVEAVGDDAFAECIGIAGGEA